jgi:hypothetical protein
VTARWRGWTTYLGVAVMTLLLALYLAVAVQYGIALIGVNEPVATTIGIGLLVFPFLGLGVITAELVFTVRGQALARRLEAEGGMPTEELPLTPSGRIDRKAADALFPTYEAAAKADPENWRTWFRLGLAYDACGDRRRARWATRQAIRLAR